MAITDKQLAGNQRRTLRALKNRLLDMSAQWDGLDQYNMSSLSELADKCEQVAADMVPDPVHDE